jgi:hypothetical protein
MFDELDFEPLGFETEGGPPPPTDGGYRRWAEASLEPDEEEELAALIA